MKYSEFKREVMSLIQSREIFIEESLKHLAVGIKKGGGILVQISKVAPNQVMITEQPMMRLSAWEREKLMELSVKMANTPRLEREVCISNNRENLSNLSVSGTMIAESSKIHVGFEVSHIEIKDGSVIIHQKQPKTK